MTETQVANRRQKLVYVVALIQTLLIFSYLSIVFYPKMSIEVIDREKPLQLRAKTAWLSNHPKPVQSINYTIARRHVQSRKSRTNDTETENFVDNLPGNNLLDEAYWYSSDQISNLSSMNFVKQVQNTPVLKNDIKESLKCPTRKPVIFSEDGHRQIPKELYNMAPEIFDTSPTRFLDTVQNPCWKEGEAKESNVFCLPAFFLAGFPKAGTSDLWDKIVAHPDVKDTFKEPHWWARKRYGGSSLKHYMGKFFSDMSDMIERNHQDASKTLIGDGSASTIWDNANWQSYFDLKDCKDEGPPYVIADIIHTVLPNSRIIVIMRDPATRLYSYYNYFGMFHGGERTPEAFHRGVLRVIDTFQTCMESASYRTCTYTVRHPTVRLVVGLYSVYVRDWLKVFPRDQIMFLRLEDWHGSCPILIPKVYNFLQLEPLPESITSDICATKLKNPTIKHKPMMNKTRQILDEFYLKTKVELTDILNDDRYLWR